eukprot:m.76555 g.76555  ORF g.76555 m.76555 type:complete len:214 (+) comp12488_c0_seq3:303-944(+)
MGKSRDSNGKAIEAKARQVARKQLEDARRAEAAEAAKWEDHDPSRKKKEARKQEKEAKQAAKSERKRENRVLAEQDAVATAAASRPKLTKGSKPKATRYQILLKQMEEEKLAKAAAKERQREKQRISIQHELLPNTNQEQQLSASSVEAAIEILGGAADSPAKPTSVSALYAQFEEEKLAQVKAEFPQLRLQQQKAKVRKMWERSKENPANYA